MNNFIEMILIGMSLLLGLGSFLMGLGFELASSLFN